MPLAVAKSRGSALKARLLVNGIQNADSFVGIFMVLPRDTGIVCAALAVRTGTIGAGDRVREFSPRSLLHVFACWLRRLRSDWASRSAPSALRPLPAGSLSDPHRQRSW